MKVYNKLVRDKIPAIIKATGGHCLTRTLTAEEFLLAVDRKLNEELAEYHQEQTIEELADLLEVIYAAAAARGYTAEMLDHARELKAESRGRFETRTLLLYVTEEED